MRSVYADGALQVVRNAIPVAGLEGDVVNADDVGVAWIKKKRRSAWSSRPPNRRLELWLYCSTKKAPFLKRLRFKKGARLGITVSK